LFILGFVSTVYRLSVCLFVFCLFVLFYDLFIIAFVSTNHQTGQKDRKTNRQTIDSRYKCKNKQIIKQDKKTKEKQKNRQTIDSRYKGENKQAFVSTVYRLSVFLFLFCLFVLFYDLFILAFVSTVYRLSVCLFVFLSCLKARINKSSNGTKRQKTNRQTIDSRYKGENKQIIKRDKKTKGLMICLFSPLYLLSIVCLLVCLSVCLVL
jgi:Flp pilus assembly protein TadB